MEKLLGECNNRCWCEKCGRAIEKGEKFLIIFKNARRGTTRTNICKDCLIRMFIELNIKNKEFTKIKKEMIIDNL